MTAISLYARRACQTLAVKFWGALQNAAAAPISAHTGFSPMRNVTAIISNTIRSPVMANLLNSNLAFGLCLCCVAVMSIYGLMHGYDSVSTAAHLKHSISPGMLDTCSSRRQDVPLG